jgi:type I restriction enzyme S subunit
MDSSLYSKHFKSKEFLIKNYKWGTSTVRELGFKISRGQNLQISSIGKSVRTKFERHGYYKLILPNYISKYGTLNKVEYLGNSSKLKTLKKEI